jgi:hypothetical protein
MLGDAYARQVQLLRVAKYPKDREDAMKKLIAQYSDGAAVAFSRIVTRYPAMPRAPEAAKRLAAMGRPVPKPTPEAIELNRREQASRGGLGHTGKVLLTMHKRPDYLPAATIGEPTLVDPQQTDAATIVRRANEMVLPPQPAKQGSGAVTVDTVKGASTENSPTPRSDPQAQAQAPDAPAPAPAQTNEANASAPAAGGDQSQNDSSSKPKKSGLRKLIPF